MTLRKLQSGMMEFASEIQGGTQSTRPPDHDIIQRTKNITEATVKCK